MRTRWFILLVAICVTTAALRAEEKPPRPERPVPPVAGERAGTQMLERIRFMLADLKLTDEQKPKVDEIFKKARHGLEQMREEAKIMASPRDRMERVNEFFRDFRDDLAAVLNDEQRTILDRKLEEAKAGFRRGAVAEGPKPGAPAGPGGTAGAGGPPQRPGEVLERLGQAVQKLDLTEGQKVKIRDLLEDVRAKGSALRQQAQVGENVREQARQLLDDTRRKVDDILTPVQQKKLNELLNAPPATQQAMMMDEGDGMMMAGAGGEKKAARKPIPAAELKTDATAGQVGNPAPQLALKKLDGTGFQLSALRGRVVVLEFGSYSCPAFRERVAAMEKLKTEYSTRAQFFVVYMREAHAKDEWEVARNKDAEISVDQPKTAEARIDLAKKARDSLNITVPILLDTLGNDATIAYGAGPNSAFVINRDGMIVARQQWFDPNGLRRAIDEAAKATPATKPAI